jgi:hypothetical protein
MDTVMTAQRWRRLDALFQEVLDCPAAGREALIDAQTEGDADLRSELEEMLAHSGDAATWIARSIGNVAQLASLERIDDWSNRRIGPWRLVREIGRGGMGIVFEASRDDAEYRRTVAIKLVPAWRSQSFADAARLRHERQILAGLDHPNIARFLDGGTENGIPYFVMEYVDGTSLAEWRRQHKPTMRESIELFRQVCSAVHYAHESLIVHRDLKPANILVSRDGVPKLLDFGIAKLLVPFPEDGASTTGTFHWTPDYTSPEQVRGGPVTVRTDVYSLGLILYELLCGERAQAADSTTPLALDRSICETEPALPSFRAAAREDTALQRQLRGDLDTIVAMAISKDPRGRYSSAAALSDDLERWLTGKPVRARPSTLAYRIRKLVRRQRFAFGAGALVAATAIAGVVATVHQARRAENRFQQVRSLANAFVFDVHDRIQSLPGATEARKAIVATGLRYLESLRQDAAGDPSLALELAAAYQRIGDAQGNPLSSSLHETEGALNSYKAARALLSPLFDKRDERAQLPMAQIEFRLGLIEYAQGQGKPAADSFGRALEILRPLMARRPNDVEALTLAGDVLSEMARDARDQKQAAEARQAAGETVDVAHRLAALQPSSIRSLEYLAVAQSTIGESWRATEHPENAVLSFREAIASREQLVLKRPQNTNYRRDLMISYGHLSDALGPPRNIGLGDLEGASQALAKATEIARWLIEQDPSDRTARNDLANVQSRAGDVLLLQPARIREALQRLEESETLLEGLVREDPANERARSLLLYVQRRDAEALELLGRDAEAARKLAAVRKLAGTFGGTRDADNARAGYTLAGIDLARIEARSGDAGALALANRTAAEISTLPLRKTGVAWGEATVYADMGRVYGQLGEKKSAEYWLQKSAAVWREMKIPAALDTQRAAQLAAVEKLLKRTR